jgi:NADPH2:quinone reductase
MASQGACRNTSSEDLVAANGRESEQTGIHVIVDYLWGRPTEAVIVGITRKGLMQVAPRVRLVEVGQVAGTALHCPPVLRSSGLEIYGCSAGTAPIECVMEAIPQLVELAASGKLSVDVETIPLAEVESAWQRPVFDNRRLVFVP